MFIVFYGKVTQLTRHTTGKCKDVSCAIGTNMTQLFGTKLHNIFTEVYNTNQYVSHYCPCQIILLLNLYIFGITISPKPLLSPFIDASILATIIFCSACIQINKFVFHATHSFHLAAGILILNCINYIYYSLSLVNQSSNMWLRI
jgi:hypothetical protein